MIKLKLLKHQGSSMIRFTLLMFLMFGMSSSVLAMEMHIRPIAPDPSQTVWKKGDRVEVVGDCTDDDGNVLEIGLQGRITSQISTSLHIQFDNGKRVWVDKDQWPNVFNLARAVLPAQRRSKQNALVKHLDEIIRAKIPGFQRCMIFGSVAYGMTDEQSDLDVALNFSTIPETAIARKQWTRDTLKLVAKELERDWAQNAIELLVDNIRVPILKLSPVGEEGPSCACDIKIGGHGTDNRILEELKTKKILSYIHHDSRVRELGMLVKKWAKSQNICDGRSYLPSFGYLVMVIHYLNAMKPYERNMTYLSSFRDFFQYYINFNWNEYIVDVEGAFKKPMLIPQMHVMDPVEADQNLARNVNQERFWQVFHKMRAESRKVQ